MYDEYEDHLTWGKGKSPVCIMNSMDNCQFGKLIDIKVCVCVCVCVCGGGGGGVLTWYNFNPF